MSQNENKNQNLNVEKEETQGKKILVPVVIVAAIILLLLSPIIYSTMGGGGKKSDEGVKSVEKSSVISSTSSPSSSFSSSVSAVPAFVKRSFVILSGNGLVIPNLKLKIGDKEFKGVDNQIAVEIPKELEGKEVVLSGDGVGEIKALKLSDLASTVQMSVNVVKPVENKPEIVTNTAITNPGSTTVVTAAIPNKRITFSSDTDSTSKLYAANLDGTNRVEISSKDVAWSKQNGDEYYTRYSVVRIWKFTKLM
jgi:hypothetical protein